MSRLDEQRFTALGQEWTARFDFNAVCAIEEETGKGFYEFAAPMLIQLDAEDAQDPAKVFAAVSKLRMSDIRLVLFHALSGQHENLSIEDVGDIIGDIGTPEAMKIVASEIMKSMASEPDEDDPDHPDRDRGGATRAGNPPKKRRARKPAARRG